MDVPSFTIGIEAGGVLALCLDPVVCACWRSMWPILYGGLNRYSGFGLDDKTVEEAKYTVNGILYDLKNKGYLYKDYDSIWQFDALTFSLNCIGHNIRHGIIDPDNYGPMSGYNFYPECLIEADGELCQQIKRLPAETIEQLADLLCDETFNAAVELYKNHYIELVARI